jgi:hypothetical protein
VKTGQFTLLEKDVSRPISMLNKEIAKQCIAEYETDSGLMEFHWIDDAAAELLGKDKSWNPLNLNS